MWKILLLLLPGYLFATGDSLRYLTPRDTIVLSISGSEEKIFEHKIVKGQTIFSLAKFYGLKMDDLRHLNPSLNFDVVNPKQSIKVVIPNRAIIRYREPKFNPRIYTPVYYRVKKRGQSLPTEQGLFSHARRHDQGSGKTKAGHPATRSTDPHWLDESTSNPGGMAIPASFTLFAKKSGGPQKDI